MRRRRGAIHSNDQEEYIKLSILSEKNIGIFYNENLVGGNTPQKDETWEKFDYNQDDKMKLEEMEQEDKQTGKIVTYNIMVLHSNIFGLSQFVKKCICSAMQLPQVDLQSKNPLELIIKQEHLQGINLVIKLWVTTLEYHTMLESYYKRAQMFILIGGQQDQKPLSQAIQNVKTLKGQKHYDQKLLKAVESNQKQLIQELRKVWNCLRICSIR